MNWKNPIEVLEYHRNWRRNNRARCNESSRKYRQADPQRTKEQELKGRLKRKESGKTKESFKKWYDKNVETIRAKARLATQERKYRKLFGIGLAEKERMYVAQNGRCEICSSPISLGKANLDHNHLTMQIRALLCGPCNAMLGYAKEKTETLANAILYLKRFQTETK